MVEPVAVGGKIGRCLAGRTVSWGAGFCALDSQFAARDQRRRELMCWGAGFCAENSLFAAAADQRLLILIGRSKSRRPSIHASRQARTPRSY